MAADTYRTIQGDTFDIIAFRLWGNEHLCNRLMEANPSEMDMLFFPAGMELKVPEVVIKPPVSELPPWYVENKA